eukprot:ctg_5574.g532
MIYSIPCHASGAFAGVVFQQVGGGFGAGAARVGVGRRSVAAPGAAAAAGR